MSRQARPLPQPGAGGASRSRRGKRRGKPSNWIYATERISGDDRDEIAFRLRPPRQFDAHEQAVLARVHAALNALSSRWVVRRVPPRSSR